MNSSFVSVYPNPTSGSVKLSGMDKLSGISTIEVFDSRGRLVMKLNSDVETVNLDGVDAGSYILLIRHDRGTERLPIVKK